jgi:hypothetical protein
MSRIQKLMSFIIMSISEKSSLMNMLKRIKALQEVSIIRKILYEIGKHGIET